MGFSYEQYELSASKKNDDNNSWSNVAGDSEDLQNQLDVLYEIKNNLEIEKKDIVRQYDEAKERKCSGAKPWHPDCWKKEADKKVYADKLSGLDITIAKNDYKISVLEKKLEKVKIEEAKKNGTYVEPSSSGTKKSKTRLYIGVSVLVAGIVAFILIKKKK